MEEALELISSFPTPATPYETRHQLVMKILVQDASKWCSESKPEASLDGETLMMYYLSLLTKHF